MANDIDMWNDIEELEKTGNDKTKRVLNRKKASDLMQLYSFKFIEPNDKTAEILKKEFEEKYNEKLNYW